MIKACFSVTLFALLLLLSACNEKTPDIAWTEVDVSSFDWYQAAGITEEQATGITGETDIDLSKLQIDINADPEYQYSQMAWLDENTLFCMKTKRDRINPPDSLVAITLDGKETILEDNLENYVITQVQGNSVVYAPCYEMVLQDGITFAVWNPKRKELNPVYHFQDGYVISTSQFLSPDGTKAAFAWTSNLQATTWRVRIVDMATGDIRDLVPPHWDTDTENTAMFSYWIDNNTLSVTESDGFTKEANCISWKCTL